MVRYGPQISRHQSAVFMAWRLPRGIGNGVLGIVLRRNRFLDIPFLPNRKSRPSWVWSTWTNLALLIEFFISCSETVVNGPKSIPTHPIVILGDSSNSKPNTTAESLPPNLRTPNLGFGPLKKRFLHGSPWIRKSASGILWTVSFSVRFNVHGCV